ncbi:MAG TPA: hypothetical protein PLC65_12995, partial [Bacteroidia bacterium]|nr:hypothetical protein [Bacteroidia bacterium]
ASGCISTSNVSGQNFKDLIPPQNGVLDSVSVNASGNTTMGWNASSSNDCIGYVIYYFNGSSWSNIDTVLGKNNTSYTSTLSASSNSVTHCIAAIDSCGN